MADPKGITPFKQFMDSVHSAKHAEFAGLASSKIAHEDAFSEMKAHITKLYEGVEVTHSFVDANGSVFDCIPVEKQPALRGQSGAVPKPPDLPTHEHAPAGATDAKKDNLISSPMGAKNMDAHGNAMHCPEGTIPMRRITLENLSRFGSLRQFFQKSPGATTPPTASPKIEPPGPGATHRWAHAYQNVNNGGGHSFLNIWDPSIGNNQIFSLSQHWYVAGSGSGLQTAECGWQVYPQFYGNSKPVFFIYYTADNYNQTGCYNMSCGAFVHTAGSFTPGMALNPPYSTPGGPQYSLELAYWHTGGRWWLYVNGTSGSNAIGYYPDSVYKGGALTKHATEIDYGGETVGTTSFPPMGSGAFANKGWQHAAYQRTIQYYPPGGGTVDASLTPSQGWPKCYTAVVTKYAAPWLETLWFGGPGGAC